MARMAQDLRLTKEKVRNNFGSMGFFRALSHLKVGLLWLDQVMLEVLPLRKLRGFNTGRSRYKTHNLFTKKRIIASGFKCSC